MPLFGFAQQIKEYKASNDVIYYLKDTVRLGRGSAANGEFLYIDERGLPTPGHTHSLPKEFARSSMIIKAIKTMKRGSTAKYFFVVDAGGLFCFTLYIDDAILAGEVLPGVKRDAGITVSVADELKKLKGLHDNGILTEAEFDARKKKLLNQ